MPYPMPVLVRLTSVILRLESYGDAHRADTGQVGRILTDNKMWQRGRGG